MKKNLLSVLALALCCVTVNAQNFKTASKQPHTSSNNQKGGHVDQLAPPGRCGTQVPHGEWESWSAEKLAQVEKANHDIVYPNGAKTNAVYTIPVIFHIVHGGTAVGVGINISQAQIQDQITIMNADYKSTGFNSGNCPAWALPLKADAQISFCLAVKNPTGGVLVESGIDRIPYTAISGLAAPGAGYSMGTCDATMKPPTIWNPTYYFNVWVTALSGGLLGYSTFPIGTTITGITGNGSATTDGVVCGSQYIGSIGSATAAAPYNKGRTLVHESGHWLGLRHINGDANCATDYANDTPTQDVLHGGCIPSTPGYHVNLCGAGTSPNGEMTMNYMDYTDDACMYMWSVDQKTRMQQAMTQGTYRSQLSASSITLCTAAAPQAPTSSFILATTACTGVATAASNGSTGNPIPTYSWSSVPSAGVTYNPNSIATNPNITFATAGNYTITCKATNSVGINSSTKTISVGACTVAAFGCSDTLTNFKSSDTIQIYTTGGTGYVGGNNSYGDLEKAEYYKSTGLVGTAKIMGGIVLFYRHATANIGTHGTSGITFKIYNGNNVTGPSGAAVNTFTNSITNILAASTATANYPYIGNPSVGYSSNIIRPYSFNFALPTTVTGDFLLGCTTSTLTGDTIGIFSTGPTLAASTAWELQTGPTWVAFNDGTTASWQLNASLAILPKLACVTDIYNVNGISGNIAIFPNPSNGVFNFAVTMPKSSDLNFTVMNSVGQVVYTKVERGVTSTIIGLDLSHFAKGIYFVNIIDSTGDKVTKKLIIE